MKWFIFMYPYKINQVLKSSKRSTHEQLKNEMLLLMSREINSKFGYAIATCHEIYRAPLEAIFITILIFKEIGIAGIFGIALIIVFVPLLCEFLYAQKHANYKMSSSLICVL